MFFERYKESYPSLNLVQNCCKHVYSFIENLERIYEDDDFMDNEIMEALYENPFQKHKESLVDTYQDAQENLQQVRDLSTMENDGRKCLISYLIIAEDSMQENQIPVSDCDKVKLAISDLDSDRDDE